MARRTPKIDGTEVDAAVDKIVSVVPINLISSEDDLRVALTDAVSEYLLAWQAANGRKQEVIEELDNRLFALNTVQSLIDLEKRNLENPRQYSVDDWLELPVDPFPEPFERFTGAEIQEWKQHWPKKLDAAASAIGDFIDHTLGLVSALNATPRGGHGRTSSDPQFVYLCERLLWIFARLTRTSTDKIKISNSVTEGGSFTAVRFIKAVADVLFGDTPPDQVAYAARMAKKSIVQTWVIDLG